MGNQPTRSKVRAADESQDWASRSDEDLLAEIAHQRSKVAFTELFNRHHARAYKIAYYLVANAALAEEIVQDAMFDIWMHAGNYQPMHARAEAWLMRVVANRGLRVVRREQNEKKRIMARMNEPMAAESPNPAEVTNRLELHRTVWELLAKLPMELRQMLVLYYVGEMTQAEISNLMKLPQSTVSVRIQDALERLRLNLKSAGLAASVPALTSEVFLEAIGSVGEVPGGIQAQIMERISARYSARTSGKSAAPHSVSKALPVVVAAFLGLGLAAYLFSSSGTAPGSAATSPAVQSVPEAVSPAAPDEPVSAKREKLHASWNFERGPQKEIRLVQGGWEWQSGSNASGAGMRYVPGNHSKAPRDALDASQRFSIALIPSRIPSGPLRLTVKIAGIPQKKDPAEGHEPNKGFLVFAWCNNRETASFTCWKLNAIPSQDESCLHTYVLGRYWVTCPDTNAGAIFIQKFDSARPGEQICFAFKNVILQRLEVHELADEEVPEALRDPEKLIPSDRPGGLLLENVRFDFPVGK